MLRVTNQMIFIAMFKFNTWMLMLSMINGYNGQKLKSLQSKVNVLERRINSETNIRSYETASIFQRLDEIDENVNRSLDRFEEQCLGKSLGKDERNLIRKEEVDFAKVLDDTEGSNIVQSDIVMLKKAFREEKLQHAKLRNELEHYKKVTIDQNTELKSTIIEHNSKIIRQDEEIQKLQIISKDLKISMQSEENESEKCATEISNLNKKIQQMEKINIEQKSTIELLSTEIKSIKENIKKTENMITELDTFSSCADALEKGYTQSTIYHLTAISSSKTVKVYCDQTTDGGGWIVFQRRMDGSEDFVRGWADYKTGFGNLSREFWLGLEHIHAFTAAGEHELRIDMEDVHGNKAYAQYKTFRIYGESQKYKLEVGGYHGNASDSLRYHNGMGFSTMDNDNKHNCVKKYGGAWWYKQCHFSNLNGQYYKSGVCPNSNGIIWEHWKGYFNSLTFTEMKLR